MKLFALVLAVPVVVEATCPNACSGHGICDKSSLCQCYANWMSADCSERTCSFGRAFVDTPIGDLDGDGTFEPQAGWDASVRTRVDSKNYIVGQTSELGFAHYGYARSMRNESWDEGHFYRECSNKGICDRETGICDCFPGFSGGACSRASCPNDCSGHGVCRTFEELDETYSAWDHEASQACVCDGGYTGPDCSKRMCPVGADPIEHAQVVDWAVQGIYFRTYAAAEVLTKNFNDVVEFLEDKPQKVYYTVTFNDEYGDAWTTSVQSVDYLTECQSYSDGSNNLANCLSTPDVSVNSDVHGYISGLATTLNTTLGYLPGGAFSERFVWAVAGDLAQQDSGGGSCDLSRPQPAQLCGHNAEVVQSSVVQFPQVSDDVYVDSLDYRLDTNIISACEWDTNLHFDGSDDDKFGLCLFVKMPAPGIQSALKINYWYQAQGNSDTQLLAFSEVSGETYGFTSDDDLDSESLVVVQDLQSKRVWNSADGDLELSFTDTNTADMDACSKRGLCDYESGICNCFSGYSGLRCDAQNAVTYSF